MTERKTTCTSAKAQSGCVEVSCRGGSKNLNWMSGKKTTSTSDDPLTVLSKFYVQMEAKISSECQGRRQHRHRMIFSTVLFKFYVQMEAKISTRCQGRRQRRHRMILSQFCRSFMSRWKQRSQVNVREEDNTDIGLIFLVRFCSKFYVWMEAKISTEMTERKTTSHIG